MRGLRFGARAFGEFGLSSLDFYCPKAHLMGTVDSGVLGPSLCCVHGLEDQCE